MLFFSLDGYVALLLSALENVSFQLLPYSYRVPKADKSTIWQHFTPGALPEVNLSWTPVSVLNQGSLTR